MSLIYLDHNATTPVREEVLEVTTRALREAWGNPSSGHGPGRGRNKVCDQARNAHLIYRDFAGNFDTPAFATRHQ